MTSTTKQWDGCSLHGMPRGTSQTLLEQHPQPWDTLLMPSWLSLPSTNACRVTREEAGVAWLWVELAKAEGAVRAFGEGTGRVLIE